jgi:hypothetical protein
MYHYAIGPMSFYLAQLLITLGWCAVNVTLVLGTCISITKILYLNYFDLMFSQDQGFVSRITLGLSLLAGSLPLLIIGAQQSINRIKVTSAVAFLMGEPAMPGPLTPMMIYGASWLIFSCVMLLISLVVTRNYEKNHRRGAISVAERHMHTEKNVSLARVLIGLSFLFLALVLTKLSENYGLMGAFPLQILLATSSICGMLVIFVLDQNVQNFIQSEYAVKSRQARKVIFGWLPNRVNPA